VYHQKQFAQPPEKQNLLPLQGLLFARVLLGIGLFVRWWLMLLCSERKVLLAS
jgi:hypothetical protein